ncbi:hypothetical protein [Nonomuraea sp. NPDC050783]|uniref:hypothetical protein n=1 Tax=Nonomuraea sp. NPDC050783 TaxID=3154634 RepID=UPI00346501D4
MRELLERGCAVVMLSRGMKLARRVRPKTLAELADQDVEAHVEEPRAAVGRYNKRAATAASVVASVVMGSLFTRPADRRGATGHLRSQQSLSPFRSSGISQKSLIYTVSEAWADGEGSSMAGHEKSGAEGLDRMILIQQAQQAQQAPASTQALGDDRRAAAVPSIKDLPFRFRALTRGAAKFHLQVIDEENFQPLSS